MKLTSKQSQILRELLSPKNSELDIVALARLADLDPRHCFAGGDWGGVDFGESDVREFDFRGADLRDANLSRVSGLEAVIIDDATQLPFSTSATNDSNLSGPIDAPITEILEKEPERRTSQDLRTILEWIYQPRVMNMLIRCASQVSRLPEKVVRQVVAAQLEDRFGQYHRSRTTFLSWLHVMILNERKYLLPRADKNWNIVAVALEVMDLVEPADMEQQYRRLELSLAALPVRNAAIVRECAHGVSYEELSKRLGISVKAVRKIRWKETKKLRDQFKSNNHAGTQARST